MKTEYEFIRFKQLPSRSVQAKTQVWECLNRKHGDELGLVQWYSAWRQYCFVPEGDIVLSRGCLADIQHFIGQLEAQRQHPDTAEEKHD